MGGYRKVQERFELKLSPSRFHSLLQLFLRSPSLSIHLTMPTATLIARGGDAKILHTTKASSRTSSLQKSTTSSSASSSSSGGDGDAGGSVGEGSRGDGNRLGRSTMIVAPPSSSSPRLRQYTHPGCSKQAQQGGVCCRHGAPSYSSSEVVATLVSPSSGGSSHCQEGANCSTPFGACFCGMIPCYPALSHDEAQLVMAHRHHHQLQLQQQARMLAYHQSHVIHQDDPNASLTDDDDDVPITAMYKSKKKAEQRAKKAEICKRKPKLVHKAREPRPHPGTAPYYPPPGYYNYVTPPQTMCHPQHQHHQQSPTHYGMHQPPLHHMQYHQSPFQNPNGGYTAAPPPPNLDETHTTEETEEQRRSRRKCSVPNCPNRVVQGGLCISHGARRKTCSHPGCMKNVKKGGLCSTHGPARKKCEFKGCSKAAVQGGRCITHGAKKKVCAIDTCDKQAILNGMCKKHHDETGGLSSDDVCSTVVVNDDSEKNGGHQRLHKVTPPHSTKTVL